jgi:hypothetical protein
LAAPARLERQLRARRPRSAATEKHPARCLRHSRHRGGSLRGSACGGSGLRPSFPPPASPAPLAHPAATRMARNTWNTPHTARRSRPQSRGRPPRRADAPLRDVCAGACWHPRKELRSAPPLRPGATARQFRPSLCRCASQPLRGILPRFGGLRAPHPPRGPQAPFAGPPGHYQSVMEALPLNLRCSPAQGLGVVSQRHSRCTSLLRGPPREGAGRGFLCPKNRLRPMGAPPRRPGFWTC